MSDQGIPMDPGMDPGMMQPQEAPMAPPAPESVPAQEELVRAIESAARAAQLSTGPTAAEDVWHYGQGAFYFAQALAQLLAPADPITAAAEAKPDPAPAAAKPAPKPKPSS